MIISGILLPPQDVPSPSSLNAGLDVGKVLTGRIVQMQSNGQGILRFPDGRGFSFANGATLKPGEAVQVEVMRLSPTMTFRLLGSSSGVASNLAASAEQSLVRAPDIFSNLLNWSGLGSQRAEIPGAEGSLQGDILAALKSGIKADTWVTRRGLTLAQVLQKSLPNISAQNLLRGDLSELVQLMEQGSKQNVRQLILQLRQVAADLVRQTNPSTKFNSTINQAAGDNSSELMAVRNTLHRLGDLLAMQEILPRTALSLDGGQLLGYRIFWLAEGGMGEAIWQRERKKRKSKDDDTDTSVTSVLLSLDMTKLGAIQARIAYAEGLCSIGISAENEDSLAALRGGLRNLRQALLKAELPLHSLELARLMPGDLKDNRMQALGLASNFSTEA